MNAVLYKVSHVMQQSNLRMFLRSLCRWIHGWWAAAAPICVLIHSREVVSNSGASTSGFFPVPVSQTDQLHQTLVAGHMNLPAPRGLTIHELDGMEHQSSTHHGPQFAEESSKIKTKLEAGAAVCGNNNSMVAAFAASSSSGGTAEGSAETFVSPVLEQQQHAAAGNTNTTAAVPWHSAHHHHHHHHHQAYSGSQYPAAYNFSQVKFPWQSLQPSQ